MSARLLHVDLKDVCGETPCRNAKMIDPDYQTINPEKEITFTSGGTESNYLALHSAIQSYTSWLQNKQRGKVSLADTEDIPHIITTNIEHVAIDLPLKEWEKKGMIKVTRVQVETSDGRVDVAKVMSSIRANSCLVTIMFANNETGVIQPIAEIARKLKYLNEERRQKGLFSVLAHSDAAQAFGKVPLKVSDESCPVDYLSICGHKFYGPRVGALYHRSLTCTLYPLFVGGGQELGRRAGTVS